ncbi:DinB family protein [Paludibacterium purpuratum]|uniref:Putative damage-inducible protein DinB n=1 Tax=Paludibacterium purpuratum TaxID=1144873 RepID=A0A4R7B0N6_9NEIS|nr:DinB family protein [Paludibacterium purpuratum]TDR76486.1 putative damage-inducible protein DinB [Paludibacterium purpuratum]
MLALMHTLWRYKAWANENLFAALAAHQARLAPADDETARRILNHVWVVEQIFQANLQGVRHGYQALNTPATPHLAELLQAQRASERWYVDYLATQSPDTLAQKLDFVFVDGRPGRMTRGEMLTHLVTHSSHHRGMVGRILAAAGATPPKDTLTVFLHTEAPSAAAARGLTT